MPAKVKRERAEAVATDGVGLTRYQLYKKAWDRITSATNAGYHLEAITLLESILTDRLESRASYLTGQNVGYQNLGPVLQLLKKTENVDDFLPIIGAIDAWREQRNRALHEMVKFQTSERPTWEDKTGPLPGTVQEGKRVLHAFDTLDKRERQKNKARPAATEPAAFGSEQR